MALENILSQEIVQKLGWTLLHFVWQAAAAALLLGILLAVLRKSSANVRYIVACAVLVLIVLLPIVTFQLVPVSTRQPAAKIEPGPAPALSPVEPVEDSPLDRALEYMEMGHAENVDTAPAANWKQHASELLDSSLPYIVAGWLLGVLGLSLWHLGGWAQLQRLKKQMVRRVDVSLRIKLNELSGRLQVKRMVRLLESALVQVPTVVGWLRPVILLPASALTGLTAEQLEALLAHELAHIRRYDYLVNMLQMVVETLGFYHPAVWWVSHKIRAERENCCDDLAVSLSGDRIRYARALASMEEIRSGRSKLAVAAAGGSLFSRIRRLIGKESSDSNRAGWIPSVITILLIAITVIPTTLALNSQAEDKIGDEPKINTEGQEVLKQMAERNRYWLIGPPTEVRNYSYDFSLHSLRLPKILQDGATGSKSIAVENPSEAEKRIVQGIRYSSVLQKLAINPSTATITKLEHDKTKGRVRLDFTLSEPARVECGNGISGLHIGKFGMNVSSGSLWLDAKNKVPIELKAEGLMEHFSEYVEAGKSQYVPLRIDIHRYITEDTGRDRSMNFDFKFCFFKPGLWLFDQSSYQLGKTDLPLVDKPLVAYTSNIKINGTPRQKNDIDVKSSKMAARSNLKELDLRSQSIHDLYSLMIALNIYTRDHDGQYPDNLEALKEFAEEYPWILENIKYLGKGKTTAEPSDTIIAYDRELLGKIGGTNVLLNDSRIVFLSSEQLDEELQKSSFDLKVEEDKLQLNDILEKFSDGTTADKSDNSSKSLRESVENYIAAALAGEDEKAAEYAYPGTAVAAQTKDMREVLQGQDIKIVAACIGEWNSLAISSATQADHGRTGSVIFHLKKLILDQKVHWLIDDIDIKEINTIGEQISFFLNNVPEAKTIIISADKFANKQADASVEGKSSDKSRPEQTPEPNVPEPAKSVAPAGMDKSIVRVDLSVLEVPSDLKVDSKTMAEISKLLGSKITIPDSPAAADLLRKAAKATAPAKDDSAGDKRITQKEFNTLSDLLVSQGYVKILMNPTLQVVDGETAKIISGQKIPPDSATSPSTQSDNKENKTEYKEITNSIQITPDISKDGKIILLQVEAELSAQALPQGNEKTPVVNRHEIATEVRLSPGESRIISGTQQAGLITKPGKEVKDLEVPAKDIMVIITPTIVDTTSNQQDRSDVKDQATVNKEYEVIQLSHVGANEATQRINKALQEMLGSTYEKRVFVQPLENTGQIIIFGRKEMREIIKKLINELDIHGGLFVTQVFQLKYACPDLIKEKIEGSYKHPANEPHETVRVIAFPTTKQVAVVASPENLTKITNQIAEWDTFQVFKPRIIKLQNSDPVQMARLLTKLFSEEGGEGVNTRDLILGEDIAGPLSRHFVFEDVPGTSKIIVISNIPEAYEAVAQLILELDKQKMATKDVKQVREWIAGLVKEGPLGVPKTIGEPEQSEKLEHSDEQK